MNTTTDRTCAACGVPYDQHTGLVGACQELQATIARLESLTAKLNAFVRSADAAGRFIDGVEEWCIPEVDGGYDWVGIVEFKRQLEELRRMKTDE